MEKILPNLLIPRVETLQNIVNPYRDFFTQAKTQTFYRSYRISRMRWGSKPREAAKRATDAFWAGSERSLPRDFCSIMWVRVAR